MGSRIMLNINPDYIQPQKWKKVYRESLSILNAYPLLNWKEIESYWRVYGDDISGRWEDTFELHEDLDYYCMDRSLISREKRDILIEWLAGFTVPVFDGVVEDNGYDTVMLGIAALFESRFPAAAVMGCKVKQKRVEKAVQWLGVMMDRPLSLPVRFDGVRLCNRITKHLKDIEAIRAVDKLYLGEPEHLYKALERCFSNDIIEEWIALNKMWKPLQGK